MSKPSKEKVLAANIELHTALADVYNKEEPHWRPENVAKVTKKISNLKEKTKGTKLLDLGCGTGFVIEIAKKLEFSEIHGFDITKAMTDQIDRNYAHGKINITLKDTAEIDSPSNHFDVATAYTFISHLDDIYPTLNQAYRCLRPGGVIYSDLDPNASFWHSLGQLDEKVLYDEFINREIRHTKNIDVMLFDKHKIPPEIYNTAEYQKSHSSGLSEEHIRDVLEKIGFKNIQITYEWFIGQGILNNDPNLSVEERNLKISIIEDYLKRLLPMSRNMFKYISFTAEK